LKQIAHSPVQQERRLYLVYESLDDVVKRSHPDNPKGHDLRALAASFARFGYVSPFLVNDATDALLEGHGRAEELVLRRARGEPPPHGVHVGEDGAWMVPVVRGMDLDADDARAYLVAANRLVEVGGWNLSRLGTLLEDLSHTVGGLAGVGYSLAELDDILAALKTESPTRPDPDEAPSLPAAGDTYVRAGQTWCLDDHRLRCGDATIADDVAVLMNGRTADLAITDPPYNVDYGHHGGAVAGRRRSIANDALDGDAWKTFVSAWVAQLLRSVSGAAYVFMSSREWPVVSQALADAGAHWSDTIIWAKDQFTLGRADYQRQFEPIWYGWPKRAKRYWCGDRTQGDVWSFPKPFVSELHPTMKPVALIERAIANSSRRGDLVLDLFAGSGTTIIAAERQGRVCYAMELDPAYAQVSIERWKHYTGRTAQLEQEDN
jgi:DNA modification methylase